MRALLLAILIGATFAIILGFQFRVERRIPLDEQRTTVGTFFDYHSDHIKVCETLCSYNGMIWKGIEVKTLDTERFLDSKNLSVKCLCGGK